MELGGHKVKEARSKEIQYVREKRSGRNTAQTSSSKWVEIIMTRRIDINKGDDANPVYRSLRVGKQFSTGAMEDIFAGTPPLEA